MKNLGRTLVLAGAIVGAIATSVLWAAFFALWGVGAWFAGLFGADASNNPFVMIAVILGLLLAVIIAYPWVPVIMGFIASGTRKTGAALAAWILYLPVLFFAVTMSTQQENSGYLNIVSAGAAYLVAAVLTFIGWLKLTKGQ